MIVLGKRFIPSGMYFVSIKDEHNFEANCAQDVISMRLRFDNERDGNGFWMKHSVQRGIQIISYENIGY